MASDHALPVTQILWRKVQAGEYATIERAAAYDTGGGASYIDLTGLPTALGSPDDVISDFTNQAADDTVVLGSVAAIGAPDRAAPLQLAKGGRARWRITQQNRHHQARHPAWRPEMGFPTVSAEAAEEGSGTETQAATAHLHIYVVRTADNRFFAGFTNSVERPRDWPPELATLFGTTPGAGVIDGGSQPNLDPAVSALLARLAEPANLLLHGPPGTGKTRVLQQLFRMLRDGSPGGVGLFLHPKDAARPFSRVDLPEVPAAEVRWMTFHQSIDYADVVIGLRPDPTSGGPRLVPRLGTLLDLATRVDPMLPGGDEAPPRAVLFIDELNRANVSRAFGEVMTFLDRDYRRTTGGTSNASALPVPLPRVRLEAGGQTEPIECPDGTTVTLPAGWTFPENVSIVASMNSVDRAVAPLDSALARRFQKVEFPPDLELLARWLDLDDVAALLARAGATNPASGAANGAEPVDDEDEDVLDSDEAGAEDAKPLAEGLFTWGEIGWLLLHRVNYVLASLFGADFELGHAYLLGVADAAEGTPRRDALAKAWDERIAPQLFERLAGRPDQLDEILRAVQADGPGGHLYRGRAMPADGQRLERRALERVVLRDRLATAPEAVEATLRRLAGLGA